MRNFMLPALAASALLLNGCVAKTVFDIATMPVKAGAQAADWATTSQAEADRNYGKKMRQMEAREGAERKKHRDACKKRNIPLEDCPYTGYRAGDPEPR